MCSLDSYLPDCSRTNYVSPSRIDEVKQVGLCNLYQLSVGAFQVPMSYKSYLDGISLPRGLSSTGHPTKGKSGEYSSPPLDAMFYFLCMLLLSFPSEYAGAFHGSNYVRDRSGECWNSRFMHLLGTRSSVRDREIQVETLIISCLLGFQIHLFIRSSTWHPRVLHFKDLTHMEEQDVTSFQHGQHKIGSCSWALIFSAPSLEWPVIHHFLSKLLIHPSEIAKCWLLYLGQPSRAQKSMQVKTTIQMLSSVGVVWHKQTNELNYLLFIQWPCIRRPMFNIQFATDWWLWLDESLTA